MAPAMPHRTQLTGRAQARQLALACAASLALAACAIPGLKKEVARVDLPLIGGLVSSPDHPLADDATVVVGLYVETDDGTMELDRVVQTEKPWAFLFPIEQDGTYHVLAWVDLDLDLARNEDEALAISSGTDPVEIRRGRGGDPGLRLELGLPRATPPGFDVDLSPMADQAGNHYKVILGRSVEIGNELFDPSRGNLGMWKPTEFLKEWGFGIYIVGEWDPDKIPVLFVYGISGSPDDWRWLFEHIDRDRYQLAFFDYPTGIPLIRSARGLAALLAIVRDNRNVDELHIVSHSMGGLVTRGAILQLIERGDGDWIASFTTISTPWNGHAAAAQGVRYLETPVPAWLDMQPNSPYIDALFAAPLCGQVDFHMLFGYRGRKQLEGDSTDGTVAISSQLDLRAQADAVRMRGLNHGHVDILREPETLRFVEESIELGHSDTASKDVCEVPEH